MPEIFGVLDEVISYLLMFEAGLMHWSKNSESLFMYC